MENFADIKAMQDDFLLTGAEKDKRRQERGQRC